ncbi:MAG: ferric reductase-like transmembrane domain-containing protein [Patescibacteria group bacterium]
MTASQSLWLRSTLFAAALLVVSLIYSFAHTGSLNIALVSDGTAFTAGILIGCSFVLSSLSYFFDFLDSKLKYRKQIGILGYYFALVHIVTIFIRFPDTYIHNFPSWMARPDAILGILAMFILTYMAIISTDYGTHKAGKYFRPLLRTGYIAYGLLVVRAYLIQNETWFEWLNTLDSLPPPRLILTIFAIGVISLRIIMQLHIHLKRKPQTAENGVEVAVLSPSPTTQQQSQLPPQPTSQA